MSILPNEKKGAWSWRRIPRHPRHVRAVHVEAACRVRLSPGGDCILHPRPHIPSFPGHLHPPLVGAALILKTGFLKGNTPTYIAQRMLLKFANIPKGNLDAELENENGGRGGNAPTARPRSSPSSPRLGRFLRHTAPGARYLTGAAPALPSPFAAPGALSHVEPAPGTDPRHTPRPRSSLLRCVRAHYSRQPAAPVFPSITAAPGAFSPSPTDAPWARSETRAATVLPSIFVAPGAHYSRQPAAPEEPRPHFQLPGRFLGHVPCHGMFFQTTRARGAFNDMLRPRHDTRHTQRKCSLSNRLTRSAFNDVLSARGAFSGPLLPTPMSTSPCPGSVQ